MDKEAANKFKLRKGYLDKLKVEYRLAQEYRPEKPPQEFPRAPFDLRVFESVRLPFTPREWFELCQCEGQHYVGGCCGNMSAVQDEVSYVFRIEAGWMPCEKLEQIATAMIGHDCAENEADLNFNTLPKGKNLAKVVQKFDVDLKKCKAKRNNGSVIVDPWYWMALLWHIVKDHYVPACPRAHVEHTPFDDAVHALSKGLRWLDIDRLFSDLDNTKGTDNHKMQHNVMRLNQLACVVGPLKVFYDEVARLHSNEGISAIEGYAVVEKEKPDKIAENGYGYVILPTQKEVDKLFKLWKQQREEHETGYGQKNLNHEDVLTVRKVRVTLEKGIEFL